MKLNEKLKDNGILHSGNARHHSEWNLGSLPQGDNRLDQFSDFETLQQRSTPKFLTICWITFLNVFRLR